MTYFHGFFKFSVVCRCVCYDESKAFKTIKQVNTNVSLWKWKGIYTLELNPLLDIAPDISYFGHKISLRFNNSIFSVTQNNYKSKILYVFIVYALDNWPRVVVENFTIKKVLFGTTNIVKFCDKHKCVQSGY